MGSGNRECPCEGLTAPRTVPTLVAPCGGGCRANKLMNAIQTLILVLNTFFLFLLMVFGAHRVFLMILFYRVKDRIPKPMGHFDELPRVSLRLIWHAADEEFPPSATLLLPANIEEYFCSEDIVVLSECLVARLGGRPYS